MTAYELRSSYGSSDVCSSALLGSAPGSLLKNVVPVHRRRGLREDDFQFAVVGGEMVARVFYGLCSFLAVLRVDDDFADAFRNRDQRSEEHTSELQSLMRISYAVFCLKKKKKTKKDHTIAYTILLT